MNILVTGANGQLGNVSKGTEYNFVFTDVTTVEGVELKL